MANGISSPQQQRDNGYRHQRTNQMLKNAFAGGCAGLVSSMITCPLDMIKIRLQNKTQQQRLIQPKTSAFQILRDIWMKDGLRGLYRGVYSTATAYLPTWAIYFLVYDFTKSYYTTEFRMSRFVTHLTAFQSLDFYNVMVISVVLTKAALHAGITSTILTNPLWVIRTRIMTQSPQSLYNYTSTHDALTTIWRREGWKAFYKGLGPSILGVSHVGIQFPVYEKLKRMQAEPSSQWILTCSAVSKMIASSVTYPHEVIRTRLHTQTGSLESLVHTRYIPEMTPLKPKYRGIIQSAGVILGEEGWKGFYRGFGINLVRTVPASAVTILTYEIVKDFLG